MSFSRGNGTAVCSVVNDEFVIGFLVLERTLRKHNPHWTAPFYVISEPSRCALSAESRALIGAVCTNVQFVDIDPSNYQRVFAFAKDVLGTPPRLLPAFYILEALRLRSFERLVCLDSDMVVVGNLDALVDTDATFSAVQARSGYTLELADYVNTGVMVVGAEILKDFSLDAAVTACRNLPLTRGSGKADQAMINQLMDFSEISYLDEVYNFTKRNLLKIVGREATIERVEAALLENDVRILHYVGSKPWGKSSRADGAFTHINEYWHVAARRVLHADVLAKAVLIATPARGGKPGRLFFAARQNVRRVVQVAGRNYGWLARRAMRVLTLGELARVYRSRERIRLQAQAQRGMLWELRKQRNYTFKGRPRFLDMGLPPKGPQS